ncbi:MAG: hypothetical protein EBS01_06855 [Verrucomicrobia bacterium]|nr:hypothetical protein [Verrucomicrobiota bacterium]
MFPDLSALQNISPTSVEEVLSLSSAFFAATGLQGVDVAFTKAADSAAGLKGASFCVTLPTAALEALFDSAAKAAGAEQGIQVTRSQLRVRQEVSDRLEIALEADARAFLGALTVRVTGSLVLLEEGTLRFDGLKLDVGTGMFAGMAGAVLKPKLLQLGSQVFDMRQLSSGFGLRVTGLRASQHNLQCVLEVV